MIDQTDEAALAAILAKHLRTPVQWEPEPGISVRVGPEALAKRLILKLKEARVVELMEDGDHYVGERQLNLGNGFLLLWAMVIAGTAGLALLVFVYFYLRKRDG